MLKGDPMVISPGLSRLAIAEEFKSVLTTSSSRSGPISKALEKTRRGSSARSNSIGDGPQIHSTNHRHNFMVNP